MMNCRPPQTVRGPRRIAFAPAPRGEFPRIRVRSAAFFARRLRRFFQVIFSKGTYNRKWYIVGRGAALPRAGHLLDRVAPAAASPHPAGAGVLDGPFPSSSMPPAESVPRPRARVTFGHSPKSDQKRCLKPQVSRLPARLGYAENLLSCTTRSPKCCILSYNESLAVLLSLPLLRSARGCAGLPFGRLSNRALAASGGKCRGGPLGRGNTRI